MLTGNYVIMLIPDVRAYYFIEVIDLSAVLGQNCTPAAVAECLQPMTDVLNNFHIDQLQDTSLDDFCG